MDVQRRSMDAIEGRRLIPSGWHLPTITPPLQPIEPATDTQDRLHARENRVALWSPIKRSAGHVLSGRPLPARLRGAVIALGNFDGFHRGHQEVAARAVALARSRGVAAILGTFDPHPSSFFKSNAAPSRLTTLAQRQCLAATVGIDAMMVFEFDAALSAVTPEDFVQNWLADLGGVVTGEDFRFGRGRAGDVKLLEELGVRNGLVCASVAPVRVGEDVASSTRIRNALKAGDCGVATHMLTRPYTIDGVVRPGRRIDPACPVLPASIELGEYLRPRHGTYAVRATRSSGSVLGGSAYLADTGASSQQRLELFLEGLGGGDFGSRVEVELIRYLHDAVELLDARALGRQAKTACLISPSI